VGCPNLHQHYRLSVVLGRPVTTCLDCGVELMQKKCLTCGEIQWVPRADVLSARAARATRPA
jgi:hypothetical protein